MTRFTLQDDKKLGDLPQGQVLNAKITKCEEVEKPWLNKRTGEPDKRVTFEFTFTDEPYVGRREWEDLFTDFYIGERCQLYVWTLKILDLDELPEGFVLDTSAFVGSDVQVVLGTRHFRKRDGTPGSAVEVNLLTADEAQAIKAGTSQEASEPAPPSLDDDSLDDDEIEPF